MTRRSRRWVKVGIPLLLLVWAALVAFLVVRATDRSRAGVDAVDSVRSARTYDALVDPATSARLAAAHRHFDGAAADLGNPLVAPARMLPILGRQIRAAERLDAEAAEATAVAVDAVAALRRITAGPAPRGRARSELVRELAATVRTAEQGLRGVDPGDDEALVASLRRARDDFADALAEATDALGRAGPALDGFAGFLDGGTYLLFGANNAEMRAGSGMYLSVTELTVDEGHLELGEVVPTRDLALAEPVPTDPDVQANWDWLEVGRDFRNLGLTPRFDVTAETAARMWEARGGTPVDGVITLDVDALRSFLQVVGPVEVDGVRYDARNVRRELLNTQYRGLDREERTDRLGAVARAVFSRFEAGGWDVGTMASELIASVGGRHLLVWSADPSEQDAWEAGSAAGLLDASSLMVSTVNRSANKLDWFLDASTEVELAPAADGSTGVTVRTELANVTPEGQPRYVAGPNVEGLAEGEYTGVVVVNVPGAARDVAVDGGEFTTADGPDGPTRAVGVYVRILRGERVVVTTTFTLPPETRSLRIEPSARVKAMVWTLQGRDYPVERRRTLQW